MPASSVRAPTSPPPFDACALDPPTLSSLRPQHRSTDKKALTTLRVEQVDDEESDRKGPRSTDRSSEGPRVPGFQRGRAHADRAREGGRREQCRESQPGPGRLTRSRRRPIADPTREAGHQEPPDDRRSGCSSSSRHRLRTTRRARDQGQVFGRRSDSRNDKLDLSSLARLRATHHRGTDSTEVHRGLYEISGPLCLCGECPRADEVSAPESEPRCR